MNQESSTSSQGSEEKMLGYITNVSPMKNSGSKKYFNFNVHTKSKTKRGVCFSPNKRPTMTNFQNQKVPVKIEHFRTNSSPTGTDVIIHQQTNITSTVLSEEQMFTPVSVPTDTITSLNTIKNAIPEQFVTIKAKVHSLGSVKRITTKLNQVLRKQEGILLDPTGQIKILLWEDQVDSVKDGETYIFKNIRVKDNQFKERYLNPPKNINEYSCTSTCEYEEKLPEAEVIPDTIVEATGNICGIANLSKSKICLVCGTNIIPKNNQNGNCPKCKMIVRIKSCNDDWHLKIIFVTNQKKTLRLSVFNSEFNLLLSLCNLQRSCTEDEITEALLNLDDDLQIEYDAVTN
ncbi:uncharacterized protein LOC117109093 [Anneissia japonica]|uniref:uncharacterized protein LOC117109093 n=1 Tax=Anneissia japonica TaxID=1529436 RepID=UPI00142562C7|nr:uncharacterized protein LOC117109093 [Anneissia japonica]